MFLQNNPAKRITAEKALLHDYFTTNPKPARPNTREFPEFPTSHEFDTRKANQRDRERNRDDRHKEIKRMIGEMIEIGAKIDVMIDATIDEMIIAEMNARILLEGDIASLCWVIGAFLRVKFLI